MIFLNPPYRNRTCISGCCFLFLFLFNGTADAQPLQASSFDCLIEASTTIKLATPVSGLLKEVVADRGQLVSAGDVVARLDSAIEEDALAIAEARAANVAALDGRRNKVDFLQRKYDRMAKLVTGRISTSAQADEAETELRGATSELADAMEIQSLNVLEARRARRLVEQRTIRTPISGIVTKRALAGGEYAYEQAYILEIAQTDPLNVELFLPIEHYRSMAVGDIATIHPTEPIGGAYPAAVTIIDPVFDQRSGTFGVRLSLPNPDHAIPAGLRCKVAFARP